MVSMTRRVLMPKKVHVNDTFGHSDKPINLRWNINDDVIEMVACTDINAGDELFISYGDRYWT
jgi:hypothetical protein